MGPASSTARSGKWRCRILATCSPKASGSRGIRAMEFSGAFCSNPHNDTHLHLRLPRQPDAGKIGLLAFVWPAARLLSAHVGGKASVFPKHANSSPPQDVGRFPSTLLACHPRTVR